MKVQKKFEDRLSESRIISITGYLDSNAAANIIFSILSMSAASEDEDIQLFIASQGGSHLDMMAIYDTLTTVKCPVVGVCVGSASGYAALLLAKCTKGKRFALKHSEINFSQPYGYLSAGSNQQTEIAIEAREAKIKREVFEAEMAKCTGKSVDQIHDDCEVGVTLTAEQAIEYGIIDEIL
ncbi:MAG: ATP-dependent Clp protease proteolytic subunit [Clostridia bacterium]|nr:ATP-dependent Clp protease proteolytic subunit [Clostridia bacterium]